MFYSTIMKIDSIDRLRDIRDALLVEQGINPTRQGEQAIKVVVENGMASTSLLQRKLKLGYARAARIVDEMEQRGVVGPYEGSKPRKVLITKEQLMESEASSEDWFFKSKQEV